MFTKGWHLFLEAIFVKFIMIFFFCVATGSILLVLWSSRNMTVFLTPLSAKGGMQRSLASLVFGETVQTAAVLRAAAAAVCARAQAHYRYQTS